MRWLQQGLACASEDSPTDCLIGLSRQWAAATMTKKWGSDTTIRFIKEYEKHPCLWDFGSPFYKNREARENAYREISRAMSMPGFDSGAVKAKIRILRNTYNMELSKISKATQASTGEVYRPTLAWFPFADRFLKKVTKRRDLETILKKEAFEDVSDVGEADIEVETEYGVECPQQGGYMSLPLGIEAGRMQELDHLHQQHQQHQHQGLLQFDEFDAFARSIACQMRQLPLELAVELQADIQTLISQKRLVNLRHAKLQSGYRQLEVRYPQ